MTSNHSLEPMLDMYIFETTQNIEQLEAIILTCEKDGCYTQNVINEIFRIMHTIKGSSAMMLYNDISTLAHSIEDLFYYLREQKPQQVDCSSLSDLIFEGIDFIKIELEKIKNGDKADGNCANLTSNIKEFLELLKSMNPSEAVAAKNGDEGRQQYYIAQSSGAGKISSSKYKATVFFEEGCEMENIRAYAIVHNLKEFAKEIHFSPEDIIENDSSVDVIKKEGFKVYVETDKQYEEMEKFFMDTVFLKDLELIQLESYEDFSGFVKPKQIVIEDNSIRVPQSKFPVEKEKIEKEVVSNTAQSIVSVNVSKLDKLMDLVGEMVIAEAMVTQNPDLKGLELENFQKAARQLHKITSELQDMVMSIRMVPLSATFHKMHRVVRDMCKKLDKEVDLQLIGEETEVDKNIIEHISDPLMHLIRNSIDHGIESTEDRQAVGKGKSGKVILEAKNLGSDVLIIVRDDGKGLTKEKILKRARENEILTKPEGEMSDKEIYNLIFLPGFSTKDTVSEFSGRGVGMDVVINNLKAIGGTVSVDSTEGAGTAINLKIPLTLAIIDGMNVKVGNSRYTIPIIAIKESFRPKEADIIKDPDNNEMIMVRGQCYPILRLHQYYKVKTEVTKLSEGVLIMVEHEDKSLCIFADELLGQQQVVVKALPNYIKNTRNIRGVAGCTLLGDGSISLIIDVAGIFIPQK